MRRPPDVLEAFGTVDVQPLAGGEGTSWHSGDVVLKPVQTKSGEELEWQGRLFDEFVADDVRVPRLVGVHAGWCAWTFLEGEHREAAWTDVVAAGRRFHAAIAHVPRPAFLDTRSDAWALGDRVAWGELDASTLPSVKHLSRLLAALRPVSERSQLVHGDLTGNVLFARRLPPAVIDFSPYWRPLAFADAIVVGDALLWEGADATLVDAVADVPDFPQYLLRALAFRAVADALFRPGRPWRADDADCFLPPVELACSLAR